MHNVKWLKFVLSLNNKIKLNEIDEILAPFILRCYFYDYIT